MNDKNKFLSRKYFLLYIIFYLTKQKNKQKKIENKNNVF